MYNVYINLMNSKECVFPFFLSIVTDLSKSYFQFLVYFHD